MQPAFPRSRSPVRRPLALVALAGALAAAAPVASAQETTDFIKPGEDTLTLNLGAIVNNFSTSVRFDGNGTRGSDLDLEGNGLAKTRTSLYASGTWRFLPNHRIDAQYWNAHRSGTKEVGHDVVIDGNVVPLGVSLSVDNRTQFFTADYRYSFVRNESVEVAGALGLYGGQFKYDISATGSDGHAVVSGSKTASTTVPLPLIGVTVDWYPQPRWRVSGDVTGMKARIGDVDGSVLLAAASTDYMLTRNIGIGARYMYSDVSATVTKSSFNGELTFRTNAISVYAKLMY
ncbi:MAG: hypothetical protein U1F10_17170 [Burkholderiales bacterium]